MEPTFIESFDELMKDHLQTKILMDLQVYVQQLKEIILSGNRTYHNVPHILQEITNICKITVFESNIYKIGE